MSELLEVSNLKKYFPVSGGFLHAVDDVTFSLRTGETLGIVGESGCGKSTLGRVILGLLDATQGSVRFEGAETVGVSKRERLQRLTKGNMINNKKMDCQPYRKRRPAVKRAAFLRDRERRKTYKETGPK